MIINGENLILGRLCSYVAKKALLGEKIDVVNCEKIVVTGKKENISKRYKERADRGDPLKGPYTPKVPDRFVRRAIRGMLPYKKGRGREAFKNVMCHISVPEEFKNKKIETLEDININRAKIIKYKTIGSICKQLKQR
jgi:large subunit ribosomal protein L13